MTTTTSRGLWRRNSARNGLARLSLHSQRANAKTSRSPSASEKFRFHLGSVAWHMRECRAGGDVVLPKMHARSSSEPIATPETDGDGDDGVRSESANPTRRTVCGADRFRSNILFCAGRLVDDHEFERLLTSNHRLFLICIINSWAQTLYLLYLYTLRILELFLTFRPFTALITVDSPL